MPGKQSLEALWGADGCTGAAVGVIFGVARALQANC
jgi:hypothetical protein